MEQQQAKKATVKKGFKLPDLRSMFKRQKEVIIEKLMPVEEIKIEKKVWVANVNGRQIRITVADDGKINISF